MDVFLKIDGSYYHKIFLKECKYIEKKVIRDIHDNLSDFSRSSDNFDEEKVKAMKLMFLEKTIFENILFEGAILRMYSGYLSSQ